MPMIWGHQMVIVGGASQQGVTEACSVLLRDSLLLKYYTCNLPFLVLYAPLLVRHLNMHA
jgi:hypothetical protein